MGKFKHHILLHFIIVLFGFTGILGVLIELDPIVIVWYRMLIAFVALGVAMLLFRSSMKIKPTKKLLQIGLVGIVVGLHWTTFYQSISLSTASLGILCLSTTTVHVAWIEPIVMKRKFSWFEFFLSMLVVYGIYFVSEDFNAQEYEALAYGLASAFFAAVFAVFNSKIAEDTPPTKITFIEMIAGFIFLSIVLLFQGKVNAGLLEMSLEDLLWLLFLGVVCTSFAFLAVIEIMKTLGAFTVSLSINLEPVYTIVLAIFILHENELLSSDFYIGSAIIVFVVIANAIFKSKFKRRIEI